ncbi:tigger transposable element-derived protein 3 [Plakobranchus ocellatus]|uniref:Tigger transposable element-derived protein 3 n=1 Tax=Plakobranchus ocellatus TaxID=259542 RepID=A0AAV4B4Q3_9GAST|nr:tigger transposable element-derived protein 3 [Plakobranchus ocellatus]
MVTRHCSSGSNRQGDITCLCLARILRHVDHPISSGWLDIFKVRLEIAFKAIGEITSANNIDMSKWDKQRESILKDYQSCDIFNAYETVL